MTYNPPTLRDLGAFWTDQGGVNLGVVGDTAHAAKGYSYHLGEDQLTADAYSRRTARDRAGLTNAASAIDLGKLGGTLAQLREFSVWLVAQGRANAPGTSDIREVIYTADGKTVLRWDRERGFASAPLAGEADDSHLTHTHVSFYRDAETRDHTTAFRPYFGGDDMGEYVVPFGAQLPFTITGGTVKSFGATAPYPPLSDLSGTVPVDAAVVLLQAAVPHGPLMRVVTGATGRRLVAAAAGTLGGTDCTDAVDAEHERVRTAAIAAVSAL